MSRYKVKGKRRKKKNIVERYAALPEKPKSKSNPARALALLIVAAVLLGVYITGWTLQDTAYFVFTQWVTMIYYLALPLLIVVFVLLNKGISNDIPTREQLSDSMTDEEKDAFIADVKACRRRSRPLLIPIIPLALIVGFDILISYFSP